MLIELLVLIIYLLFLTAVYIPEGHSDAQVIKDHGALYRLLSLSDTPFNYNERILSKERNGIWHTQKSIAYGLLQLCPPIVCLNWVNIYQAIVLLFIGYAYGRTIVHPIATGYYRGQKFNVYSTCDSMPDDRIRRQLGWKFWLFGWDWWDGLILTIKEKTGIGQYLFAFILILIITIPYFLLR